MEELARDVIEAVASENMREFQYSPFFWILRSIVVAAIIAAALWGTVWILERAHWRDIRKREAEVSHITLSTTGNTNALPSGKGSGQLVAGSVVVSHDTVRKFSVFVRRVFGGSIRHYERLIARGRCEALNRLRAEAAAVGGTRIHGIRFQTVNMSEKRPIVAIIAFGTAY